MSYNSVICEIQDVLLCEVSIMNFNFDKQSFEIMNLQIYLGTFLMLLYYIVLICASGINISNKDHYLRRFITTG